MYSSMLVVMYNIYAIAGSFSAHLYMVSLGDVPHNQVIFGNGCRMLLAMHFSNPYPCI